MSGEAPHGNENVVGQERLVAGRMDENRVEVDEPVEQCADPMSKGQRVSLVLAMLFMVMCTLYLKKALESEKGLDFMYDGLIGVCSFLGCVIFVSYAVFGVRLFNPLVSMWNRLFKRRAAAPRNDDLELVNVIDSRSSSSPPQYDAISQHSNIAPENDAEPGTRPQSPSGSTSNCSSNSTLPSDGVLLQPSAGACAFKATSQLPRLSQIGSSETSESSEVARSPTSPDDGIEVSYQSSRENASESEGLSSGELRRRKFPNPGEVPELSSSSDEDFKKD